MDALKNLKIPTPLCHKSLRKIRETRAYINIIKAIFSDPIAKLNLNGEKLKSIPLNLGMREGYPLYP